MGHMCGTHVWDAWTGHMYRTHVWDTCMLRHTLDRHRKHGHLIDIGNMGALDTHDPRQQDTVAMGQARSMQRCCTDAQDACHSRGDTCAAEVACARSRASICAPVIGSSTALMTADYGNEQR